MSKPDNITEALSKLKRELNRFEFNKGVVHKFLLLSSSVGFDHSDYNLSKEDDLRQAIEDCREKAAEIEGVEIDE